MKLKEKLLNKSNSYKYYKDFNQKLLNENELLKAELEEIKLNKQINLKDEFLRIYGPSTSFCNRTYLDYYLRDDFEDKFKIATKNLDKMSKDRYKLFFLRALLVNLIKRDTLYFSGELITQKKFKDFERNNSSRNIVDNYNFFGEYNIHSFIDLNLNKEERKFIKNKDIIDAGAFTGDTSIPLSKITEKNVYAFEPFKKSFDILDKNIKSNNINNIIPINKSLGNIVGDRILYLSGDNVQGLTADSNIREYNQEIKVQETTIDNFVHENDLHVGYITVDIEGSEIDLLNGAIETIKSQKPILRISIYHKGADFFEIIPWIANLNLGYEFKIFKEHPWSFIADTVVQCTINR